MACHIIKTANQVARDVPKGASLSASARGALLTALERQHRSQADLAAIVARHGDLQPFTNLSRAGRRHAAAISKVMKAYGITVGKNAHRGAAPAETSAEAQARIEASMRADVDLFDEALIPAAEAEPGLAAVFSALRDAARDRHLPALMRHDTGDAAPDLISDPGNHGCSGGRRQHGHGKRCGHRHGQNKGH